MNTNLSLTKNATVAVLSALMLAGSGACTMAPRYQQPEAPIAKTWPSTPAGDSAAATDTVSKEKIQAASDIGWREFFSDPCLQRIIALGLENNRDLRVAALRVEQMRAQYQIQRSALYPSVAATASGTRQRTPGELNGTGSPVTANQYSVGLGLASYELDFFGHVRSLKDAALETYLATDEARRTAHLSLVAGIASQYLAVRSADEQLTLVRETLKLVEDSHRLIKLRFDAGSASELDLRTAETQVYTARANLAEYTRQRDQATHALVLLVGMPLPDDLPTPVALDKQGLQADIPAGLPSDLLQRRPDILQAEHGLRSSNANIGAARAAFFPSITLTVFGGTASAELDGLFKSGSGMWSFAPKITLPIFTAGRNVANLKAAQAAQEISIAQYEKAVQAAFREVADGLSARATYVDQVAAQAARVNSEQHRFDLADMRYQQGVDNYLTVITAQQSLYSAQQGLIQTRFAQLSSLVDLYKALGGGWVENTAQNDGTKR